MYYKKQGNTPPVIRSGCSYCESHFYNGYLYLKYSIGNIPSEELTEITQDEYEANKPVISESEPPKPEPTETERIIQGFTDSELRDLEIQQNQELLAQQITDIEVALLGGGR